MASAETQGSASAGISPDGAGMTAKGIALVMAQVLPVIAIVSLFPAIPRLTEHFGGQPHAAFLIPMILTIPSFCVALLSPFVGSLVDRVGRRPCMIASLALYIVAGLAPLVLDDLRTVVISRAILGIAEAGVMTISSTLIGDYFGDQRYRWLSWAGAAQSICGTLLIAAGGALADISWRGPFAVYLFAIPSFVLALFVIDEPLTTDAAGRAPVRLGFPWREASTIGAVVFVTSLLYNVESLHIAAVLVAHGVGSATRVGLIQAATSLSYVAGSFLYRRLHALNFGSLLAIEGVLMGTGMIITGLAATTWIMSLGALFQQLGAGMFIPSTLAWGQSRLPLEQRGRGMGIWSLTFYSGLFLCPPLVTLIGGQLGGLQPAILVLGLAALPLAGLAAVLFGSSRRATPLPFEA